MPQTTANEDFGDFIAVTVRARPRPQEIYKWKAPNGAFLAGCVRQKWQNCLLLPHEELLLCYFQHT